MCHSGQLVCEFQCFIMFTEATANLKCQYVQSMEVKLWDSIVLPNLSAAVNKETCPSCFKQISIRLLVIVSYLPMKTPILTKCRRQNNHFFHFYPCLKEPSKVDTIIFEIHLWINKTFLFFFFKINSKGKIFHGSNPQYKSNRLRVTFFSLDLVKTIL